MYYEYIFLLLVRLLLISSAAACNLYYCQPILSKALIGCAGIDIDQYDSVEMAKSFNIDYDQVSLCVPRPVWSPHLLNRIV